MSAPEPTPLDQKVAELIGRGGRLPFSTVMDLALYDPDHGFYASGGSAGRRGDFITSPEVGPLFGAVVARALDSWWEDLGRPDPFFFFEMGAGVGTLAISILAAAPRCAGALRYVLIERSAALAARHRDHLVLADLDEVYGSSGGRAAPMVASTDDLPQGMVAAGEVIGVVFANELLDNLPFDLVISTPEGWADLLVGPAEEDIGFDLQPGPIRDDVSAWASRLLPHAPAGVVAPVFDAASLWIHEATWALDRGRIVIVDYGTATTAELVGRGIDGWLRAFRGHERIDDPLAALGTADLTADIAIDGLGRYIGPMAALPQVSTQADWLRAHGIDELVEEGRQAWEAGAATGDLAALRARSRVREAEALLDPEGLGAFLVAQWVV